MVIGYVENIFAEETFKNSTTNTEFRIQKFVLNNNNGIKIQCNMYDSNIEKFKKYLNENEVTSSYYK